MLTRRLIKTFSKIRILSVDSKSKEINCTYYTPPEETEKVSQKRVFGKVLQSEEFEAAEINMRRHKSHFSDECKIKVMGGLGGKGSCSFERGLVYGQSLFLRRESLRWKWRQRRECLFRRRFYLD